MKKYVGISCNVQKSKEYWKARYPNLQNWKALTDNIVLSRIGALNLCQSTSKIRFCEVVEEEYGEIVTSDEWHIYYFELSDSEIIESKSICPSF